MRLARTAWLGLIGLGLLPGLADAWTGGTVAAPGTSGYTVDTTQRNDVIAFWQAVYQASEGYPARIAWTGSYGTSSVAGVAGTTSTAFVDDVKRRVNFMRALCGVPANCRFNNDYLSTDNARLVDILSGDLYAPAASTLKATADQQSALMIGRAAVIQGATGLSYALSHSPNPLADSWTTAAWNGNARSNLAYGFYGPGAVDNYMMENVAAATSENTGVGHRRWLLNLQSTSMATGDLPGKTPESNGGTAVTATNALYVVQKTAELNTSVSARFVPYPAAGYFPAKLNSKYWSLSYPGADFSQASVVVKRPDNTTVPLVALYRIPLSYGDNAITWQVPDTDASQAFSGDATYTISVSNVTLPGFSGPQSKVYTTTFINPDRLTDSLVLSGPTKPLVSTGASYTFSRPALSDAVEVGLFQVAPADWTEGAEASPTPMVIDHTTIAAAPLLSTVNYTNTADTGTASHYYRTGTKAFRLTIPTTYDPSTGGAPDQSFEIDRDVIPATGGTLNFYYRRGYMTTSTQLLVESSLDGGLTWTVKGTLLGTITASGGSPDTAFTAAAVSLDPLPQRIRFRLNYIPGASGLNPVYTYAAFPTYATGIFIDDITMTNCTWLSKKGSVTPAYPSLQMTFDSAATGGTLGIGQTWWLRMRAQLGGHWFPYGAATVVTPLGPLQPVGSTAPPVAGATYTFNPIGATDSYTLDVSQVASTTWTEGAEASPVPKIIDGTGAYDLISTKYHKTGTKAFRLALDNNTDSEDTFIIDRDVVPSVTSNLTFATRRRRMLTTNFIHAEVSNNDGLTWTSLWNEPGTSASVTAAPNPADASTFVAQTVSLSSYAGQMIRVRFAFRKDPSADTIPAANNSGDVGVWIDNITVTNALLAATRTLTTLPGTATSFRLDATSAGAALVAGDSYRLDLRQVNGGIQGAWGEPLTVVPTATPLTGFAAWQTYDYPTLLGVPFNADSDGDGIPDGVEFAFSLNPLIKQASPDTPAIDKVHSKLSITRPLPVVRTGITYSAEWSDDLLTWSSTGVTVTTTGGNATATAPLGSGKRFLRWKIVSP